MKKFINKKQILIFIAILVFAILGIYLYSKREIQPTITGTTPMGGATEVSENSQISIDFKSNIQEKAKKDISITFSPEEPFDSTWLVNSLKIIPKTKLQNNSTYRVGVLFKNKSFYSFSFETATFSQEEINKYGGQQAQSDYTFGQVLNGFVKQNPWYTLLPIRTADYTIYYDSNQQKFSIAFTNTQLGQEQQNSLVQNALADLRKIGVKDPIPYYIFQP